MEAEPQRRPQARRTAIAPPRKRSTLLPAVSVALFAAGLSAFVLLAPRPPRSARPEPSPEPAAAEPRMPKRATRLLVHIFHLERSGPVDIAFDGRPYGRVWVDASGSYFYVPVLTRKAEIRFTLVLGEQGWSPSRCEGEVCPNVARAFTQIPMDIPLTHERGARPVVWMLYPPEDPPPTHVVRPGDLTPE